jgi:hypothetical protein
MSISGSLEDVSVADVMQFIHLGQRTGTLVLRRDGDTARVGFHCGKLVSAYVPGRPRLGTLLVDSGLLTPEVLAEAIEIQSGEEAPRSLGQILVGNEQVDPEKLREVIVGQIESTVSEAVTWDRGTFEFVVDDLRPVDDIALYPGDVIPNADINTQMVLLEAARIFDERNRGEGSERPRGGGLVGIGSYGPDDTHPLGLRPAGDGQASPPPPRLPEGAARQVSRAAALTLLEPDLLEGLADGEEEPSELRRLWLDVVSTDETFIHRLTQALSEPVGHLGRTSLEEAGLAAPRDAAPVAVLDLRSASVTLEGILTLHRSRPRLSIVTLVEPGASFGRVYAAGAKAVLPAEVEGVVACVKNLAQDAGPPRPKRGADPKRGVARLRRVFGDLRSGLISATVALNLMHIISESVERAVLFLVKRDELVALGAFGSGTGGRPLAELTRGLSIHLTEENALTWSLEQAEAQTVGYDEADLPERFTKLVGRPANSQVVVFPVLGAQRVISIIYTDNGDRGEHIEDIEILELATAQVGMAFENELLRRQISEKV